MAGMDKGKGVDLMHDFAYFTRQQWINEQPRTLSFWRRVWVYLNERSEP